MKRVFCWLFVLVITLLLTSCSDKNITARPSPTGDGPVDQPQTLALDGQVAVCAGGMSKDPVEGKLSPLIWFHMATDHLGWALSNKQVVHTGDGAITWVNVTPPCISDSDRLGPLFVLDNEDVWLAVQSANNTTTIIFTRDTGKVWNKVNMPKGMGEGVIDICFRDKNSGWLMLDRGGASGKRSVDIFKTSHGGERWELAVSSSYLDPQASPISLHNKTGLSFSSQGTGIITGSDTQTDKPGIVLDLTQDGGNKWTSLKLPLPSTVQPGSVAIAKPPLFFEGGNGVLPVMVHHGAESYTAIFYRTFDGGVTWGRTSSVEHKPVPVLAYSFLSPEKGWASDGSTLYLTIDGGKRWETLSSHDTPQHVLQLLFSTDKVGWALVADSYDNNPSPTRLMKTTDGGHNWTTVWHSN